jgi:hypothetical protein
MSRNILFFLLAAALIACGGGTSLDGTVDGRRLNARRAVVGPFRGPNGGTFLAGYAV